MGVQEEQLPDEEAVFARLMKRLTGKPMTLPENEGRKLIQPRVQDGLSIVEVTEELMRQLKK